MNVDASQPFDPPSTSRDVAVGALFRSPRFWIPAIVCAFALVAVPVAFIIGAVVGNTQIYHNFSEHQATQIEAFLAQYPDSFSGLTVEHASSGWAFPHGSVPQQSDYDLLADGLHEMFGSELSNRMMYTVSVKAAP